MVQDEARPDTLAAVLAELTAEFDAAMPSRIAALGASLDLARTGSRDGVGSLVDGLHRLAGNAGTFGHGDVSALARTLEASLDAARGAGTALDPSVAAAPGLGSTLDDVGMFLDDLATRFPAADA
jgi:HPt (histidine-containing phosphotransfer) domain-containing protein